MRLRVPGDKSLTQRALILAGLAEGTSRLRGLLSGGDAVSTAGALRRLGVGIPELPEDGAEIVVEGVGLRGLRGSPTPLDLGNSGTGARLLLGVLAGAGVEAVLTGDASLRARPMRRVTDPLETMGARLSYLGEPDRLPLHLGPADPLAPLEWESTVASAQVKSALLLAGVCSGAFVLLTEPRRSRDHTERLLTAVGAPVLSHAAGPGWRVELRAPPARLAPLDFEVPGDVSSAAFLLALGALGGARGPVRVDRVGLNPTRTAFLAVLERMGATVTVERDAGDAVEPIGSVSVEPGSLRATEVGGAEVPGMIDELPLVAVLGARAEGLTRIEGAAELRHKESDRISALVDNLRAVGVEAEELPDGLEVQGGDAPLRGRVDPRNDHRIAMAFGVLGALASNEIEIVDADVAGVSFPGFWELLARARSARNGAPS